MNEIIDAFGKAARDLIRPGMLWHALWPSLVAATIWIVVAIAFWSHGIALMGHIVPQLPWAGWEWLASWAAGFLLLAALATLTYFTALFLVAVVALPMMINQVATRDYPDLVRHGENAFLGSLGNTLSAGAVFLFGGMLSLPLLLLPGALLIIPLLWAAWLNQRTFAFDSLAEHATRAELSQLIQKRQSTLYLAGLGSAALAHVPLLQLFAPAFTALAFVHFGLSALRQKRQQEGIQR